MKALVGFARVFVGILFIFSGFVKLNDPVGFSYKLQEYFSPGVLDIPFLIPVALALAVILVIAEVILGVTLLLGYLKKFTVWSLLLMIAFFTFLTFYSAYFNKVTDCGCFGDAIPLTPWESFYKDVILSVLILILFFNQKYINPIFKPASHKWIVFVVFIGCLGFAYHVLMHLPAIDFRAYKVGANISEGMKMPADAKQAVYDYNWKFNVGGQEKIVTTQGAYPSVDGEFIEVNTEVVEEGYEPPIHDFSLQQGGEDFTEEILSTPKVLMVSAYNLSKSEKAGWSAIKDEIAAAQQKGYRVIGLSASGPNEISKIKDIYGIDIPFYFADETAIKTIVRSNPGLVTLEKGTIMQKLHWNDAEDLKIK
jgi:uncharacterized membrane protein YphA (DoxX/SURF4 family)